MRSVGKLYAEAGGRSAAAVFFGVVTAAVLGVGLTAFACTPLNTINLSSPSGRPGTGVTATGSFLVPDSEVAVRWNSVDGPVLARTMPVNGEISASFVVPDGSPGYYAVVATQSDANGNPLVARAAFQMVDASGQGVPSQPAAFEAPTRAPNSSGAPVALALVLGFAGVALLGAGGMAVAGHARRRQVAEVASLPRD